MYFLLGMKIKTKIAFRRFNETGYMKDVVIRATKAHYETQKVEARAARCPWSDNNPQGRGQ